MPEIDTTTDMKFEDGQTNLTEEQYQKIAAEALQETKKDKKEDRDNDDETTNDKREEHHEKEVDAEKEEVKETEQKEEVKDQKQENKKPAEDKVNVEDARKKYVEDFAKSHNLSIDQATEEVAKNDAVIEKYGKDPARLAAELRKHQSELGKSQAEIDRIKRQHAAPQINNYATARSFVDAQIKAGGEKLVEAYRSEYPGLTENLSDDACRDLMRKEATEKVMGRIEEQRITKEARARDRRQEILSKLPDDSKPYLTEVKSVLDKVSDEQLLADGFDATDIIYWAKGKNMKNLIKEAEEHGFKRGLEAPKIISQKVPVKSSDNQAKKTDKTSGSFESLLTKFEKEEALGKFDGQPMSDEEKYKAYHEIYKAKKK